MSLGPPKWNFRLNNIWFRYHHTLLRVGLSCLWGSPVITTSGIFGVSSCVSPFFSSFFTWDVLREYWAPPGDYAIKLFPCLFTTAYGLGSKRVVSLFFLSCCTSAWSPRSTSECLAFLCMPEYALPLLF